MSNLLIVESDNDRYFLEVLIKHLNLKIEIGQPICLIDDFDCLEGLSEKKLTLKLENEKLDKYDKVGILVDADHAGIEARIQLVKSAMQAAGIQTTPNTYNQLSHDPSLEIGFAIGITHLNDKGELETLLKEIAAKDPTYANCLEAWKTCVEESGKSIKQKEFDKFWISNYFRYDTCSSQEKKQADRKCSKAAAFQKEGIWNLEHEALNDLKTFLELFRE